MSIWSCPEKKIPIIMRHFLDILYKSLIDNSYEVMNEKMDHADEKCKWIVSWGVESLKSSATASKHWITAENLFWVAQTVEFTSKLKILKFEYPLSNDQVSLASIRPRLASISLALDFGHLLLLTATQVADAEFVSPKAVHFTVRCYHWINRQLLTSSLSQMYSTQSS